MNYGRVCLSIASVVAPLPWSHTPGATLTSYPPHPRTAATTSATCCASSAHIAKPRTRYGSSLCMPPQTYRHPSTAFCIRKLSIARFPTSPPTLHTPARGPETAVQANLRGQWTDCNAEVTNQLPRPADWSEPSSRRSCCAQFQGTTWTAPPIVDIARLPHSTSPPSRRRSRLRVRMSIYGLKIWQRRNTSATVQYAAVFLERTLESIRARDVLRRKASIVFVRPRHLRPSLRQLSSYLLYIVLQDAFHLLRRAFCARMSSRPPHRRRRPHGHNIQAHPK